MFYRQSIALFGIVLPMLVAAIVVGVAFSVANGMKTDFDDKQKKFTGYEQSRIGALGVEALVSRKRQHVDLWKAKLSEETKSAISANLRDLCV